MVALSREGGLFCFLLLTLRVEALTTGDDRQDGRHMDWRKSSFSGANGDQCVEVASADAVMVRDTTNRDGAALSFSSETWTAFLGTLR
jgi:hypothetical protein